MRKSGVQSAFQFISKAFSGVEVREISVPTLANNVFMELTLYTAIVILEPVLGFVIPMKGNCNSCEEKAMLLYNYNILNTV